MFEVQIWGTYLWQLIIALFVGIFDEAILAYFYIIISQNKKIQSFFLASFITFFNLWVYVMITHVVAIENQLDLIVSYALGTGIGAIATIAMQSKGQRKKLRKALRRVFRIRRRATAAGRKVPNFVSSFAESLHLEYSQDSKEMKSIQPTVERASQLRLLTFSDKTAGVKHAA